MVGNCVSSITDTVATATPLNPVSLPALSPPYTYLCPRCRISGGRSGAGKLSTGLLSLSLGVPCSPSPASEPDTDTGQRRTLSLRMHQTGQGDGGRWYCPSRMWGRQDDTARSGGSPPRTPATPTTPRYSQRPCPSRGRRWPVGHGRDDPAHLLHQLTEIRTTRRRRPPPRGQGRAEHESRAIGDAGRTGRECSTDGRERQVSVQHGVVVEKQRQHQRTAGWATATLR